MSVTQVELLLLQNRIEKIENDVDNLRSTVNHIEEVTVMNGDVANEAKFAAYEARDSANEAVMLLKAAKGIGGFMAKHGPRILAAIMAVFAYEGFSSGEIQDFLETIFVP